jgi:hypothetical protein
MFFHNQCENAACSNIEKKLCDSVSTYYVCKHFQCRRTAIIHNKCITCGETKYRPTIEAKAAAEDNELTTHEILDVFEKRMMEEFVDRDKQYATFPDNTYFEQDIPNHTNDEELKQMAKDKKLVFHAGWEAPTLGLIWLIASYNRDTGLAFGYVTHGKIRQGVMGPISVQEIRDKFNYHKREDANNTWKVMFRVCMKDGPRAQDTFFFIV